MCLQKEFDWNCNYNSRCDVIHAADDVFMKTVVAVESTRVALQQIRGVEGSDYINASYIDVRRI